MMRATDVWLLADAARSCAVIPLMIRRIECTSTEAIHVPQRAAVASVCTRGRTTGDATCDSRAGSRRGTRRVTVAQTTRPSTIDLCEFCHGCVGANCRLSGAVGNNVDASSQKAEPTSSGTILGD